jgi:formylglycine-generating enzyme required for sulfatase activity
MRPNQTMTSWALGLLLLLLPGAAMPARIVSVLDLHNKAGVSESEVAYLTDLARDALTRNLPLDHFTIMTRESILELLPEGTRLSDCLDASCEVEIGRTLGADYVVSGEILTFAGEQRLILKVHHCVSAAFIGSESAAGQDLRELEGKVATTTGLLAERILKYTGEATLGMTPPSPTQPVTRLEDWFIRPEMEHGKGQSGIAMVNLGAGEFLMGSPRYEEDRESDEDRHQVTLTRGFLIGKTEVTQAQWRAVMASNPSHFSGDTRPVENVTFFQSVEFCNELSLREGFQPAYGFRGEEIFWNREADGYRLPTEAEWEYACRAGSQQRFTNGDRQSDVAAISWTRNNSSGRTHDVASRDPNRWGLHDMHGNVWEWCWNWSSPYPTRFAVDPEGPQTGTSRVIRGGSWDNSHEACRSANHNGARPDFKAGVLGFRVARTVFN